MKQCRLVRGSKVQIAWLPAKFAVAGKYVRLFDVDGWHIEKVWPLVVKTVNLPHGYFGGGVYSRA